ncbi:lysophospholipid acyltransferase family protein [Candidatus Phytoplasma sacchari]|nr:lysophospholipid acyltransferase family protein [Candidatus Phytoplasma sacchari]KAB8122751.1 1-acyl-sn-glycerol-3-phosphate acyltransferase [Candidatus Phytoplasma sacchari]
MFFTIYFIIIFFLSLCLTFTKIPIFYSFSLMEVLFSSIVPLYSKIILIILIFILNLIITWILVLLLFLICLLIIRIKAHNYNLKKKVLSSFSNLIINFFRIDIKINKKENINHDEKIIIYSNHKSLFDPFILASVLPMNITFAPKSELYNGFLGFLLSFCFNTFDCIEITRNDKRKTVLNIKKNIEKINKKFLSLVIFHEGGRKNKTNDKIIDSLDGSFKIALKSQSSILPISIKGSSFIIGKFWFRKKRIEIFIHPCIHFQDFKEKNTQEINSIVNNIINSVL